MAVAVARRRVRISDVLHSARAGLRARHDGSTSGVSNAQMGSTATEQDQRRERRVPGDDTASRLVVWESHDNAVGGSTSSHRPLCVGDGMGWMVWIVFSCVVNGMVRDWIGWSGGLIA